MTVCTPALVFRGLVSTSLMMASKDYLTRADGSLLFVGERPSAGRWHGHGYFSRGLWVLRVGRIVQVTLWKHR